MTLPSFVAIKSNYNGKYLRYIHEDVQVHGFHQFSGEEVVSPYTKYEVEMAKSGTGLVHIRCCYNNKYWVRSSQNHWWIVAGADEAEEDQSKWSCTLFEPEYVDGDAKTVRFRHVQLGHYACLWRTNPPNDSCLFAGSPKHDNDLCDVCTIIDWESLLILPKHVTFTGDNGKYLNGNLMDGDPYLQFASTEIGDPAVGNEVIITADGSVRIKSDYFGKFWSRGPTWIWADSDDSTNNNSDTLFWPTKVDNNNNVVALRNLGNNNFIKRFTTANRYSCLRANDPTITVHSRLGVVELVSSRNINNVNFRLMDARIFNQSVLVMDTQEAANSSQQHNTITLKFSYTKSRSTTWNSSVSLKLGVKVNIKSRVPLIVREGDIEISSESEFIGEYQWGHTEDSTSTVETVLRNVTVPPMTKLKVSLLATKGSCDVPFSYSQSDTLTNGLQITNDMEDGIYTGINYFNFKYETTEEKL